jgi:hypothetical protein
LTAVVKVSSNSTGVRRSWPVAKQRANRVDTPRTTRRRGTGSDIVEKKANVDGTAAPSA